MYVLSRDGREGRRKEEEEGMSRYEDVEASFGFDVLDDEVDGMLVVVVDNVGPS